MFPLTSGATGAVGATPEYRVTAITALVAATLPVVAAPCAHHRSIPVRFRPPHCVDTRVQVRPSPVTVFTVRVGLVEIAARYRSPLTPVRLVDVWTLTELADPPCCISMNTGGVIGPPVPVSWMAMGFSSGS